MASAFNKQPVEQYVRAIQFAGLLPAGTTIASAAVTATDLEDGTDQTAVVLDTGATTVNGTDILYRVRAGTDGHTYKLRIIATLNTGTPADKLEDDVYMIVQEE